MTIQRDLRRLEALLQEPREDLDVEIKEWLDLSPDSEHCADLARELIALANFGGGFIIIGFRDKSWEPAPDGNLSQYTPDRINEIVRKYAEPPFHCEVQSLTHGSAQHPVIIAPPGGSIPILAKRDGPNQKGIRKGACYIRKPGPITEPPQNAQEWHHLLHRCLLQKQQELLNDFRDILLGPFQGIPETQPVDSLLAWAKTCRARFDQLVAERDASGNYNSGIWSVAYQLRGALKQPDLQDLLRVLKDAEVHLTGWPMWWIPQRPEIEPYAMDDIIECWMIKSLFASDPSCCDFWRASPAGQLFLLRGYHEDSRADLRGVAVDCVLHTRYAAEVLMHAERLAQELSLEWPLDLDVTFLWEGLRGRRLDIWVRPDLGRLHETRPSKQDSVRSTLTIHLDGPNSVISLLPEYVFEATKALFAVFGFFKMPHESIQFIVREFMQHK